MPDKRPVQILAVIPVLITDPSWFCSVNPFAQIPEQYLHYGMAVSYPVIPSSIIHCLSWTKYSKPDNKQFTSSNLILYTCVWKWPFGSLL